MMKSLLLLAIAANLDFGSSQALISLGAASTYGVLGHSSITNTGPTVIEGDIGTAGTSITGFPPGVHTGGETIGSQVTTANSDATTAYNAVAALPGSIVLTGNLGTRTLGPGTYKLVTSAQLTGVLTLAGTGSCDDAWYFQIGTTLITGVGSSVILTGGGLPGNVFWQVGSSATLGIGTQFSGIILAQVSITANAQVSCDGGLFALGGTVTLNSNTVLAETPVGCPVVSSSSSSSLSAPSTSSSTVASSSSTSSDFPSSTITITSSSATSSDISSSTVPFSPSTLSDISSSTVTTSSATSSDISSSSSTYSPTITSSSASSTSSDVSSSDSSSYSSSVSSLSSSSATSSEAVTTTSANLDSSLSSSIYSPISTITASSAISNSSSYDTSSLTTSNSGSSTLVFVPSPQSSSINISPSSSSMLSSISSVGSSFLGGSSFPGSLSTTTLPPINSGTPTSLFGSFTNSTFAPARISLPALVLTSSSCSSTSTSSASATNTDPSLTSSFSILAYDAYPETLSTTVPTTSVFLHGYLFPSVVSSSRGFFSHKPVASSHAYEFSATISHSERPYSHRPVKSSQAHDLPSSLSNSGGSHSYGSLPLGHPAAMATSIRRHHQTSKKSHSTENPGSNSPASSYLANVPTTSKAVIQAPTGISTPISASYLLSSFSPLPKAVISYSICPAVVTYTTTVIVAVASTAMPWKG